MFNNEEIYDRAVKSFNEVINEKVIAATESKEWAKFKFATLTKQKLREGAIKHEAQIPITLVECIKVNRDNLQEAIEEGIDSGIASDFDRDQFLKDLKKSAEKSNG